MILERRYGTLVSYHICQQRKLPVFKTDISIYMSKCMKAIYFEYAHYKLPFY